MQKTLATLCFFGLMYNASSIVPNRTYDPVPYNLFWEESDCDTITAKSDFPGGRPTKSTFARVVLKYTTTSKRGTYPSEYFIQSGDPFDITSKRFDKTIDQYLAEASLKPDGEKSNFRLCYELDPLSKHLETCKDDNEYVIPLSDARVYAAYNNKKNIPKVRVERRSNLAYKD
jgi:hypothetical protein